MEEREWRDEASSGVWVMEEQNEAKSEAGSLPFQPLPPPPRCLHPPAAAAVLQSAGLSSQGLSPGPRQAMERQKIKHKPQQKRNIKTKQNKMHPGKYWEWVGVGSGAENKKQLMWIMTESEKFVGGEKKSSWVSWWQIRVWGRWRHATYVHVDLNLPCGASLGLFPPLDGRLGTFAGLGVALTLLLLIWKYYLSLLTKHNYIYSLQNNLKNITC